jgi:hypothetical protein
MILDVLAPIFLIAAILVAAYCWIFGAARSVYWYRQTWKAIRPGADPKATATLLDKMIFGRFAVLSSPEVLTDTGLEARAKTIAAMKMLGLGVALVVLVLGFDYFVTGLGS